MRSMFFALATMLTLSVGVVAQTDLPKRMQDTKDNFKFEDAAVPDMLTALGKAVDVEVRYQVTSEPMKMSSVEFRNASVADAFVFVLRAADLRYTVIDERTIVVTTAK